MSFYTDNIVTYVPVSLQGQVFETLIGKLLAGWGYIAHIGCHLGVSVEFWERITDGRQIYARVHGGNAVGRVHMHHDTNIIVVLPHVLLQTKMQWYFTRRCQLATDVGVSHFFPFANLVGTSGLDLYFLKLIGLQRLFAYAAWRDVKVVSVVMTNTDIAIPARNPVSFVCIEHDVTDGF